MLVLKFDQSGHLMKIKHKFRIAGFIIIALFAGLLHISRSSAASYITMTGDGVKQASYSWSSGSNAITAKINATDATGKTKTETFTFADKKDNVTIGSGKYNDYVYTSQSSTNNGFCVTGVGSNTTTQDQHIYVPINNQAEGFYDVYIETSHGGTNCEHLGTIQSIDPDNQVSITGTPPSSQKGKVSQELAALAQSLQFKDRYTITGTFNGNAVSFYDRDVTDNNFNYASQSSAICGGSGVTIINSNGIPSKNGLDYTLLGNYNTVVASVDFIAKSSANSTTCNSTSDVEYSNGDVNVGQPDNASVMYTWGSTGNHLNQTDGKGSTFGFVGSDTSTLWSGKTGAADKNCENVIVLNGGTTQGTEYSLSSTQNSYPVTQFSDLSPLFNGLASCFVTHVNLAKSGDFGSQFGTIAQQNFTIIGNYSASGNPNPPGSTNGSPDDEQTCEQRSVGFAEHWLLCPVLAAANGTAQTLTDTFESQLSYTLCDTNTSTTNSNVSASGCSNLHLAWSSIRLIASIVLVILLLVMVLSEAIGGPFDAYTVRKVLPRIVAAVILMQISWAMFTWVITAVDYLGKGLADIMYQPFGGTAHMNLYALMTHAHISSTTAGTFSWIALIGVVIAAALALPFVIAAVLTAIVALLTGLLVLIFRKIIIIMALIFAPLALVMWVLPGTQKYFKLWQDNFMKTLFMFPIVVALIAAGRIFAYVSAFQNTSSGTLLNFLIVLVGFFGPLFLLPKTYKWGGQLMNATGSFTSKATSSAYKPLGDYMTWRKGISRWSQGRKARRGEVERQAGLGFARGLNYNREKLFGSKALGSAWTRTYRGTQRSRLAGVGVPGKEKELRGHIASLAEERLREEEIKTEGLELDRAMAGRNRNEQVAYLMQQVENGESEYRTQAALTRIAKLGDGEALRNARGALVKSGRGAEWNRAVATNYGDFKGIGNHLTNQFSTDQIQGGHDFTTADDLGQFTSRSMGELAGMSNDGWDYFASLNPDAAADAIARIEADPNLRGQLKPAPRTRYDQTRSNFAANHAAGTFQWTETDPTTGAPVARVGDFDARVAGQYGGIQSTPVHVLFDAYDTLGHAGATTELVRRGYLTAGPGGVTRARSGRVTI